MSIIDVAPLLRVLDADKDKIHDAARESLQRLGYDPEGVPVGIDSADDLEN